VIACQSENNVPSVGPEQVRHGREMQWLRIDQYYKGGLEAPKVVFQPVPCMHCEKAPCEYVCPMHATTHSSEGVNEMTYNRCIGTRDCSQNCPYKVRRFNFLSYTGKDALTPAVIGTHNPDVTVRSRGVMEKCSYCIQRINRARMAAQKENRRIRDGEFTTACAEACPTRAIVFGDINDPAAEVSQLKSSRLNYAMLAELNTWPRTTYLPGVRNPNPEIARHEGQ
jgi:molybdopterin-containing oxidoreductase family iron-sulfur binding subunit